jgi:cytidylate kinase
MELSMGQNNEALCRVLTVSASYGAAGSVVAPEVAARVGLRFFNRLLGGPEPASIERIVERLTIEEQQDVPSGRIMAGLTRLGAGLGLPTPSSQDIDPRPELRRRVTESVSRIATTGGGVILGRAAAVVLAADPMAFHVRLCGPADRRLAQGMAIEGISEEVARDHQVSADRSWTRFVNRLFDRDPADPGLYHLMLDSTVIPVDDCVRLVASAATAFWERAELERRSSSSPGPTGR